MPLVFSKGEIPYLWICNQLAIVLRGRKSFNDRSDVDSKSTHRNASIAAGDGLQTFYHRFGGLAPTLVVLASPHRS